MALPPQYSEGFGGGYCGIAHAGHIQVHTREDSSNSLEEMFRVVTDPSCSLSSVKPLKDRKLPRSFFDPSPQPVALSHMSPPIGECHFRSASGVATQYDASHTTSTRHQLLLRVSGVHQPATAAVAAAAPAAAVAMETGQDARPDSSAGAASHTRAHSSPAKISNQQAAAAQLSQRQFSQGQGQGQQTFFHHHHQSNVTESATQETCEDPPPANPGCPEFEICQLPAGWEMAYNDDNRIYFVDHNSRSTSWYDPRIPRQLQSGWGQSADEVCRLHLDYLAKCNAHRKLSSLSAQKELLRRQLEAATRNEQMMRQEMFTMQGLAGCQPPHHGGKLADPILQCGGGGAEHQRQESSDSGLAPEPVITPPLLEINCPAFSQMDTSSDTSVDGLLSSLNDTDLIMADYFDAPTFREDFQGSI